jgi:2-polyprenyl-3-methyl-5-hydroxy-6-metoxy-1,4-benzoquinol methylase
MHPRISQILSRRGIARDRFEKALAQAVQLAGDEPWVSPRMQLCAAMTAKPGGSLCDAGGSTSMYLVVLACLDMEVTVIDPLPYLDVDHLRIGELREKTLRRLELFEKLGIHIDRRDVFTVELAPDSYDVCCAFETIEHFSQSPKPVLAQLTKALVPGGRLCLSVPNIARLQARMKLLLGKSPYERYQYYFDHGNPYHGHHREMTVQEVAYIPKALDLEVVRLFTSDIPYESAKKKNTLQKALLAFSNRTGLSDLILPTGTHKHIWLEAMKKPGAPRPSAPRRVEAARSPARQLDFA